MEKGYEIRPWLGSEASYRRVAHAERYAMMNPALMKEAERRVQMKRDDDSGSAFKFYDEGEGLVQHNEDGLAILTISGALVAQDSWWNALFGDVSYPSIIRASRALAQDDNIDTVVLNMATGGGDVAGLENASEALARLAENKELHTITSDSMMSAGMWLGAEGRTITTSRMAEMGSIGVLMIHISIAKMLEEEGEEVTIIRAGEYKALATPYENLSEEALAEMKDKSQTLYGFFTSHISDRRSTLSMANVDAWAEGRTFFGQEAVDIGLADGIGSITDLVGALSHVDNTSVNPNNVGNLLKEEKAMSLFGNKKSDPLTPQAQALLAEGAGDPAPEGDPADKKVEVEAVEKKAEVETVETKAATDHTETLIQLSADKAKLEVKVESLETQLAESKTTTTGLCAIASASINRMEVGVGGSASDLSDASGPALILKHSSCRTAFEAKFPVGRQTEEPEPKDEGDSTATGVRLGIIPNN